MSGILINPYIFAAAGGGGGGGNVPSSSINILVAGSESTSVGDSLLAKMISLSSSVGYPTVTGLNVSTPGDLAVTYSATGYDAIIWWNDYNQGANSHATINNFLAAGKGVIFAVFGHCFSQPYPSLTGGATATQISTSGGYTGYNTTDTVTGTTHPILYQVTGVGANQGYIASGFASTNGASIAGTWGTANPMVIYKDNSVGTSRRVDLNFWPGAAWTSEGSTTNAARICLNAFFWSARRTG
jgi:hypothetical protein